MIKKILGVLVVLLCATQSYAEKASYIGKLLSHPNYSLEKQYYVSDLLNGYVIRDETTKRKTILYGTRDGYTIQGEVIAPTGEVISQLDAAKYLAKQVDHYPYDIVQGTGPKKAVVYFDPLCHYCKELYRQVQKVEHLVTVHWRPVTLLGESEDYLQSLYSTDDHEKAFHLLNTDKVSLSYSSMTSSLTSAVADNHVQMNRLQLSVTPSGYIIRGDKQYTFEGMDLEFLVQ